MNTNILTAATAAAFVTSCLFGASAGATDRASNVKTVAAKQAVLSPSAKVLATLPNRRAEKAFSAYLTGYTYWDNTPPGSAAISKPVIHRRAGGTGKYNNPITIAVGHTIIGGRQTLDFKAGTKFYIKRLKKYAIVEDVCGDGRKPQEGPCHTGHRGLPWLDIYIGGRKSKSAVSQSCARKITAVQTLIINPRKDYPVEVGEISDSGCKVFKG